MSNLYDAARLPRGHGAHPGTNNNRCGVADAYVWRAVALRTVQDGDATAYRVIALRWANNEQWRFKADPDLLV